jgi:hypothetical protein
MRAYSVEGWGEFALAGAGAAAVLAGLVFIAVSINLERILAAPGLRGRAGESLIMFVGVLVIGMLMLVPQSRRALAIELVAVGVFTLMLHVLLAWTGARVPGRQPTSWLVTRFVVGAAVALPTVAAGASLLAEAGGGLYWLVAGFLISFVAGIGNAWVLLVEVVRDERYRP